MFGLKRKHPPPIIPNPAPGIAYIEPQFARTASFIGAVLPICGIDVLIVVVQPSVLADPHEAHLYVIAFQTRFRRAIVLMAQDDALRPTYFGPEIIVRTLSNLPFEVIPWRRMLYRMPRPAAWKLPIPSDPMELPPTAAPQVRTTANAMEARDESTFDDLVQTHILERSPERVEALARMAQTTRR